MSAVTEDGVQRASAAEVGGGGRDGDEHGNIPRAACSTTVATSLSGSRHLRPNEGSDLPQRISPPVLKLRRPTASFPTRGCSPSGSQQRPGAGRLRGDEQEGKAGGGSRVRD
jgi:hypothetical protein